MVDVVLYEPNSVERRCNWLAAFGRLASSPPAEYNSARLGHKRWIRLIFVGRLYWLMLSW